MHPFVRDQTPAIEDQEIGRLHAFRDMLVLSKKLWAPHKNISLALLSAVLEGKEVKYTPGGGAKPSTRNREKIFFREVAAKEATKHQNRMSVLNSLTRKFSHQKIYYIDPNRHVLSQ